MLWRVKPLIERLGGPSEVHRRLIKMTTHPLTPSAVRNWGHRGEIPSDWLALLLVLAKESDPSFDPYLWIDWL